MVYNRVHLSAVEQFQYFISTFITFICVSKSSVYFAVPSNVMKFSGTSVNIIVVEDGFVVVHPNHVFLLLNKN